MSIQIPDNVIVCRAAPAAARQCTVCKRSTREWKLCDFPPGAPPDKTCSAVLCAACAQSRGTQTDYCPRHDAMVTPEGKVRF